MFNAITINALLLLTFTAAGISSVTDVGQGKIYNKMIIIFTLIGLPFVITLYEFLCRDMLPYFLTNLGITIVVCLLFYAFKIWAAGDAKLTALLIFLLPYSYYYREIGTLFPAIYVFIAIFSLAFIYIVIESIFLSIKDFKMLKKKIVSIHFSLRAIVGFFTVFLTGIILIGILTNFYSYILGDIYTRNAYAFIVINFFSLALFYSIVKGRFIGYFLIAAIILNVIFVTATKMSLANIVSIKYSTIPMTITIILIRFVADTYNYKEINTSAIKKGMVLSYASAMFLALHRKGEIILTDETTKTRISEEQAQKIREWASTKKEDPIISVVRLMPFSLFVLFGLLLYLLMGVYSKWMS